MVAGWRARHARTAPKDVRKGPRSVRTPTRKRSLGATADAIVERKPGHYVRHPAGLKACATTDPLTGRVLVRCRHRPRTGWLAARPAGHVMAHDREGHERERHRAA